MTALARVRRAVGLTLLLVCLSSASAPERLYNSQITELSRRTKVLGVMVASGYQVTVQKIGHIGVVPNRPQFVAAPGDLLTDAIYEVAVRELGMEQRYEIKRLPVDPQWARQLVQGLNYRNNGQRRPPPTEELASRVKDCNCDAVALIVDYNAGFPGSEAGFHFGPSFIARAGAFGQGTPSKAHFRVGLMVYLIDPATGKSANKSGNDFGAGDYDSPDFSDDVARYFPADGETPSEAQWQAFADYLKGRQTLMHNALNRAGLRPSCPIVYYERDIAAQGRGIGPPETLPGIDPARCPIPK